jgi:tetratricopeptide (TPR) repeat protein
LKPNYAEAFKNRGEAYRHKGLFVLAIQAFDQALRLDSDSRASL